MGKYQVIWPFERECVNGAILDLVSARLRRAKLETAPPVYLLLSPKTKEDAMDNLKAFSDEGLVDAGHPPPRAGLQRFSPDPDLKDCLGWAELDGDYVRAAGKRAGYGIAESNATFLCIVYGFVEGHSLDARRILDNTAFFHTLGFHLEPFNPGNWWGRGVLVDYGDIVPPLGCFGFNERAYPMQRAWAEQKVLEMEKLGFLSGARGGPPTAFYGRPAARQRNTGRAAGGAAAALCHVRRGDGGVEGPGTETQPDDGIRSGTGPEGG
jgi:hypothetical protein